MFNSQNFDFHQAFFRSSFLSLVHIMSHSGEICWSCFSNIVQLQSLTTSQWPEEKHSTYPITENTSKWWNWIDMWLEFVFGRWYGINNESLSMIIGRFDSLSKGLTKIVETQFMNKTKQLKKRLLFVQHGDMNFELGHCLNLPHVIDMFNE